MMHGLSSCGSGALEGEDSVVVAQGLSSSHMWDPSSPTRD